MGRTCQHLSTKVRRIIRIYPRLDQRDGILLPREHLHDAISARAHDETAVLAPDDGTHAFPTHDAMAGYHLCADTLLQAPEANACIVTGGNRLSAVFAE